MKIKCIYFLGCLLMLASCAKDKASGKPSSDHGHDSVPAAHDKGKPALDLPPGYTLDSTDEADTLKKVRIGLIFPYRKGEELTSYDREAYTALQRLKLEFLKALEQKRPYQKSPEDYSFFSAWPVSVFNNGSVASYSFVVSLYSAGAGKPFSDYYSFNYDIGKKKEMTLAGYLGLKNGKDSLTLLRAINEAIEKPGVKVDSLYNGMDFCITKDNVMFNFGNFEILNYPESMMQVTVPKAKLASLIPDGR